MDRQRCTPYPPSVNVAPTPFYFKLTPVVFYIVIISVSVPFTLLGFLYPWTHHQQVRAGWVPELSACGVLNPDSFKLSITSMFITDIVLLVIMLVGLLRLRLHNFGLGELLWKQVGHATSRPLRSLMRFPCERV